MLGYWIFGANGVGSGKVAPPKFDISTSNSWKGYLAYWEIKDSQLLLKKITAKVNGKKIRKDEVISGKTLPTKAAWFSGKIHVSICGRDSKSDEDIAVISFDIKKGDVVGMAFLSAGKIPDS